MDGDETARIFKSIRRIVRAIDLRSREVSRISGLTIPQIVVLQGIDALGEVTMRSLSVHADLSAATVVTILDKLEDKELVVRYRSSSDRRIVHARLTNRGRQALERVPSLLPESFEEQFSMLDPARRRQLLEAVATISEILNTPPLDSAPVLARDAQWSK